MSDDRIIYCADIIAVYDSVSKLVLVERLASLPGFAFPGGKQEKGETLWQTAVREMKEETGLRLDIKNVLGTYAEPGRDPRGNYVSTVFIGRVFGEIKEETDKTRVVICDISDMYKYTSRLLFDHAKVFADSIDLYAYNL